MQKLKHTYRLDLYPVGGATITQAAHDAYMIGKALGVRVDVIHNDKRYKVYLEVKEHDKLRDAGA